MTHDLLTKIRNSGHSVRSRVSNVNTVRCAFSASFIQFIDLSPSKWLLGTGYSFSEALILASIKPKYDNRLIGDLLK